MNSIKCIDQEQKIYSLILGVPLFESLSKDIFQTVIPSIFIKNGVRIGEITAVSNF